MGILKNPLTERWNETLSRIPNSERPGHPSRRLQMSDDSNVTPFLSDEQIKARLRELEQIKVTLDAERDKVRLEELRLQKALIEGTREYMQGWDIQVTPPADMIKGAPS
jgi:hypothetical protein